MSEQLLYTIGGILISIISYFLKETMDDLKELKKQYAVTKNELDVLKNDHVNKNSQLSKDIVDLKDVVYDLTQELKEFRKDISEEIKKKN